MKMKNVAFAMLLCAALSVMGRDAVEFANTSKTTHYFDEQSEWKCGEVSGVLPAAGDDVKMMGLLADSTVYLRGNTTLAAKSVKFSGGWTYTTTDSSKWHGSLRFLGDGYTFLMPSLGENPVDADGNPYVYAATPVMFDCQHLNNDRVIVYSSGLSSTSVSPLKMTDPDFTCGVVSGNTGLYVTFSGGVFNFRDPQGVNNGSTLNFGVDYTSVTSTVTVASGATLRINKGVISRGDAATTGVMTLRQYGTVEAAGEIDQKNGTWEIDGGTLSASVLIVRAGSFLATNSAVLNIGKYTSEYGKATITQGSTVSNTGQTQIHGPNQSGQPTLRIKGGKFSSGTVYIAGSTTATVGYYGKIEVSDGGVFTSSSYDGMSIGEYGGYGTFEISDGSADLCRIRLARRDGYGDGCATLRQTGGFLAVTNATYGYVMFLQNASTRAGTHTIELDGGVTAVRYITNDQPGNTAATCQILANGGMLRAAAARNSSSSPFIKNLTYVKLGEKGLAFDTAGYNIYVEQDIANQDGASGLLQKVGEGTMTYVGECGVSKTVVSGGTLLLSGADSALSSSLMVTNGATFSLVGSSEGVTLPSLTVTNATLALDPGDVITVNGPISVRKLKLNWSSVPSEATPFLVVSGEMDEASKAAISSALFANALSDGTHASYTFDYDAGTGKTTVSASAAADTPLAGSVTWTGTGAWATGGNWTGGAAPMASQIASFTSSSAGKTVTVAAGDKAGALELGADGYTLAGTGPLVIAGEADAASIAATTGANTIDVPVLLFAQTAVSVDAGASLAINKPVSYGGITKTGTGKLTLGADNSPETGISSADGMLDVAAEGALGASDMDKVLLSGGTVQFAEATGAPMHVPADISVATPASSGLVVFKADTDTTLDALSVTQGAFCKRGAGKLTVNVPAVTTYTLGVTGGGTVAGAYSTWMPSGGTGMEFPADGTVPTDTSYKYPGFSIAEGEMALVGEGDGAKVSMSGASFLIGLYVKNCAVQPMLTVDNVYLDCSGCNYWLLGHSVGASGLAVTNPVLRILNGGTVRIPTTQIGYNSKAARSHVTVAATNRSALALGVRLHLTLRDQDPEASAYYRFKGSRLYADGAVNYIGGGIDLDFDESVLSTSSGGLVALRAENDRTWGTLLFRNGSTFVFGGFTESASMNKNLTFAFDESELVLHSDRGSATLAASGNGYVHYEMRGAGAILKPASGATYTINAALEGEGGLVVDGEGTVAFGANVAQFTGALDVRQGTADFSENGAAVAFTAMKGSGVVSGAEIGSASLPLTLLEDGTASNVLTFADCSFSGSVRVNLGRTEANPLTKPYPDNVLVARYTGTAPDVGTMRLVGTGRKNLRGEFIAAGGEIRMTVVPTGVLMIVR